MIEQIGKLKRMNSILKEGEKTLIVPVDDLLICGPRYQFKEYKNKIKLLADSKINAILGYPGVFREFYQELKNKSWIVNLTTSTILSEHTNKNLTLDLESAIYYGCDAVAIHVNMSSKYEGSMLKNLGSIAHKCNCMGIPLMVISYVRKEGKIKDENYDDLKLENNSAYTDMVCHAVRVAVELGADIIKTNYTGSISGFRQVIDSAGGVPVIAGGGKEISEQDTLQQAAQIIASGASGICFGRNLFFRENIADFVLNLRKTIDNV